MPRLTRTASENQAAGGKDFFVHAMPGHLVRRLQQIAVRLFVEEVGAEPTPVQFAALCAVADRPNIGQAALASLIGYDRATIGGVIDRLEQRGLIVRIPSAADRRANALALTPTGHALIETVSGKVEKVQRSLLAPLNEVERSLFQNMCLKILAHHKG